MRQCQLCVASSLSDEEAARRQDGDAMKKKEDSAGEAAPKRCAQCDSPAAPGEKLVHCAACRQICYCGRQCQQAHWSSHKASCLHRKKVDALEGRSSAAATA
jgi:hypothetical protein